LILIFGVLAPFSAISWRPVFVIEEAVVRGENHQPWYKEVHIFSIINV
jgi:hypothetical protein